MSIHATVLGCGLVGATMARDLVSDDEFEVTVADLSADNLRRLQSGSRSKTVQMNLGDPQNVKKVIRDSDIVLGAMPSALGFQTMQAVIEAGKPYCDITFMPEDAAQLDALAKKHAATVVFDCGVAPGFSNMIVGYVDSQLDQAERAEIYVGGLPKIRRWPFQYKAPFAPGDVIEEYTRPARLVVHGEVVVRPALSDPEWMDFPRVGTLEAFNTDGLRSLVHTVQIPQMIEKTLRYPGHIELMKVFRETGFFSKEQVDAGGVTLRPLDLTAKLLFAKWTYEPGEEEFTVLRVIVEGWKSEQHVRHTYDLYDEYDRESQTSSMARTTAFPNTSMARLIAHRRFVEAGVFAPETLARQAGVFDHVLEQFHKRGVHVAKRLERLSP